MAEKRLVKRNGMLFEEDEPSLMQRVQQAGVTPPTTPAGAAKLGATPDQAKMVGTPAYKKPILEEAVDKEKTLEGAQRLEQPRQATQEEAATVQKAAQVSQLGGLSGRVQALVESQLQQAGQAQQQATATVDKNSVAAMLGLTPQQVAADAANPNSNYSKILAKLQQYTQAPSESAIVELTQMGLTPQQASQAIGMVNTGAAATGQAVAAQVADQVTLGALDLTPLGFADIGALATTLGVTPEQAQAMTVPQLQEKITQLQQQEFDQVSNLRAQLAASPYGSAQRQILEQQLAAMGQVGLEGAAQKVAETAEDINLANQVTIGDQVFQVENILKDENLSNLIQQYINAPEEDKDKILPPETYSGLREWVDANQQALGDLVSTAQGTQQAFTAAQQAYKDLGTLGGLAPDVVKLLAPTYDPTKSVTSEQAEQMKQQLAATPLGAIAMSDDPEAKGMLAKLTMASAKDIKKKGLTVDQIKSAYQLGQRIKDEPTLAGILGIDATKSSDFMTNPATAELYKKVVANYDALKGGGEKFTTLLADKDFQKEVAAGLPKDVMKALLKNKDPFKDFTEYKNYKAKQTEWDSVKKSGKLDSVLGFMFGDSKATSKSLNKLYNSLKEITRVDPTDKAAANKLATLSAFIGDDGKFTDSDLKSLTSSADKHVKGAGSLLDFIKNEDKGYSFGGLTDAWAKGTAPTAKDRSFFDAVKPLLDDDTITVQEMATLPEAVRNRLFDMPEEWRTKFSGIYKPNNDPDAPSVKLPFSKSDYTTYAKKHKDITEWDAITKDNASLLKNTGLDIKNTRGMLQKAGSGGLTQDQRNALASYYNAIVGADAADGHSSSLSGAKILKKDLLNIIAAFDTYTTGQTVLAEQVEAAEKKKRDAATAAAAKVAAENAKKLKGGRGGR